MNAEQHGTWTVLTQDGRDRQVGPYMNGKRDGIWILYWGAGEVGRQVGPDVNDERHGTWTGYDQSGNRLGTIRYENGRRVGGSGPRLRCVLWRSQSRPSSRTRRLGGLQGVRRDAEATALT